MTELLRLQAEVRDNASPAIKRIKQELASIRTSPGMTEATKWMGQFSQQAEGFAKSGTNVGAIMGAMGIGGLAAGASISALVTHFKELGDRTLAVRELGREVGATTDFVNAFSHAGARFGVSAEAMQGAMNHLAGQMPEFRNGVGSLHGLMAGHWPSLTKKLQLEDTQHQIADIVEQLGKMQSDPQLQKQWLSEMFGNGDEMEKLFADGAKGFREELNRQFKQLAPITPEMIKQARDFRDATISFNDALENFEMKAGPEFLKQMTALVDGAQSVFKYLNKTPDQLADDFKKSQDTNSLGGVFADGVKAATHWFFGDSPAPDKSKGLGIGLRARKSSWTGDESGAPNGLFHRASFGGPNGASQAAGAYGLEATIAGGTKSGVLSAFRELMAIQDLEKVPSDEARMIRASYGGEDHNRLAAGLPRRGAGGADDGAPYRGTPHPGKWWTPERQEHAISKLMKDGGITQLGAEALVSRWVNVEAAGGPGSVNPRSGAEGIAQWLGSRKRGIHGNPNFDDQLSHVAKELNSTEARAKRMLNGAHNAQEAATGASQFERAEGYNPRTGADSFTGKTAAGMRAVHEAWLRSHRTATGLADTARPGAAPHPFHGSADVHIRIEGAPHKATVRSTGMIQAKLHRWQATTEA